MAKRREGKGKGKKNPGKEWKVKPELLKQEDIYTDMDSSTCMSEQKRFLKGLAMKIDQLGNMDLQPSIGMPDNPAKNVSFKQPMVVTKPIVSIANVVEPLIPGTADEVSKHICTNGVFPWLFKRLKDQMRKAPDPGIAGFGIPGETGRQTLQGCRAWLLKNMPLINTRWHELLYRLGEIKGMEIGDTDPVPGTIKGELIDAKQTAGASMGMPYHAIYGPTRSRWGHDDEASAAVIERATELVVKAQTLSYHDFRAYLKDDMAEHKLDYLLMLKRKKDVYPRDKVKFKTRGYYTIPAHFITASKIITPQLREVIANYQEVPASFSAYRGTYFEAGAAKMRAKLDSAEGVFCERKVKSQGEVKAVPIQHVDGLHLPKAQHSVGKITLSGVAFSDDSVISVHIDGRKYKINADITAADMSFLKAAAQLEEDHYLRHFPKEMREEKRIFRNLWLLVTMGLYGGLVLLGGPVVVNKLRGLNSGGSWTTPSGTINHALLWRQMSKYVVDRLADLYEALPQGKTLQTSAISEVIKAAPAACKCGIVYKTVECIAEADVEEGGVLFHMLGFDVLKDTKPPYAIPVPPQLSLGLHIVQPKGGGKIIDCAARSIGLALSGAWYRTNTYKAVSEVFDMFAKPVPSNMVDREIEYIRAGLGNLTEVVHACAGKLPERHDIEALYRDPNGLQLFRDRNKAQVKPDPPAPQPIDDLLVSESGQVEPLSVPISPQKATIPGSRTKQQDADKKLAHQAKLKAWAELVARRKATQTSRKNRRKEFEEYYQDDFSEPEDGDLDFEDYKQVMDADEADRLAFEQQERESERLMRDADFAAAVKKRGGQLWGDLSGSESEFGSDEESG